MNLKQIAPYLPYRPKVEWKRLEDGEWMYSDLTISDYDFLIRRREGKMILRPLSDLDLPCLYGGAVPIMELAKISKVLSDGDRVTGTKSNNVRTSLYYLSGENKCKFIIEYGDEKLDFLCADISTGRYVKIENQLAMFEWIYSHYFWVGDQDLFGVEVIDINNISNENL